MSSSLGQLLSFKLAQHKAKKILLESGTDEDVGAGLPAPAPSATLATPCIS